jgi:methyltransferase family protein
VRGWYRTQLARYRYRQRLFRRWRRGRRPAAEVFTEAYETNVWGGQPGELYSGDGSGEEFAGPYCAYLRDFISRSGPAHVTIVDLGCGDFRVGRELVSSATDYIGVDVVPALIERNRRAYGAANVAFACADIVNDELPAGDVCLLRQVLQHLSNAEIQRIIPKLAQYRDVFVTEHYPSPESGLVPNRDKPHGPDIRMDENSAVCLDKPPFGLRGVRLVLTLPYYDWGELRTFHLEMARDATG